jgi:hypothetical protein
MSIARPYRAWTPSTRYRTPVHAYLTSLVFPNSIGISLSIFDPKLEEMRVEK